MNKEKVLKIIKDTGVVPVVRASSAQKAIKITEAIKQGGIKVIEITMTVPGAIKVIDELSDRYKNDSEMIIGAGSILDGATARHAILAGAEFIVGPAFNKEMVEMANRYRKVVIPGAMTPTEVMEAMESGADIVKIFPATLFGPKIIKAIKGPIPQAKLLPTGGIDHKNVKDWISAGSYAVGAGSAIVDGAESDDYDRIKNNAKQFVNIISEIRK